MSDAWFYCRDLAPNETVVLDGREAKHACGARRLGDGDRVTLFDGCGSIAEATIANVKRRTAQIVVTVHDVEHREPLKPAVHLVCAMPKGDRQSVLLNMATQLGMASCTPLLCERSIVKPGRSVIDRAERICIEACKQCHQPHCPVIHPPQWLESALESLAASNIARIMFHPDGDEAQSVQRVRADEIAVLIGPEGGFTNAEVAAACRTGASFRSLGSLVLRTETAAIAALAWCRFTVR